MPFLNINNIDIHYVTGKNGIVEGRKNLAFIHGAGGSYKIWLRQLRYFQGNYNPIAIELPGHGKSMGDGEREIGKYTTWVKEIIDALSLDNCFLIGHSMGGAVTMDFSLRYPHYLNGIVLVGTGARLKVSPMILDSIKKDFDNAVELICIFGFSKYAPANLIEQGKKELFKSRPDVLHDDFFGCNNFDIMERIDKISIPALIVCGSEDKLTPPKYAYHLNERIKRSQLKIIEKAGHLVMLEKPNELNMEIEGFLKFPHDPAPI
ncbi:MAG: alpha/beta hydrolase [Desulfobacterales bacterium]|nr:alpha/beta hydrolase [Desulfobacterales bacterium]